MVKIGNIELGEFPLLLAPMEDVSDPPFRSICKELGADVVYTEFISSEGLIRDAAKSIKKLDIYEKERPVGIQIFGANLESMLRTVEIVEQSGPDFIDINFGCPVKKVVSKGAGAGILKDIPLMEKITREMVKHTRLPVTVKTRLGWDDESIYILDVAERLQDAGVQALAIHGRTRSQMYKGSANWEPIAEVKNNPRMVIPVFGNGDVDSPEKSFAHARQIRFGRSYDRQGQYRQSLVLQSGKTFFQYREPSGTSNFGGTGCDSPQTPRKGYGMERNTGRFTRDQKTLFQLLQRLSGF